MATILGTVGVFGFDEDQQGILLESQDIDYKPDTKVQRDYRSVKVGIIFYDDQTDISMKGYIPRENPTDIRVAQTLTLAQQRITELTLQYPREGLAEAEAAAKRMVGLGDASRSRRSRRDNANTGRGRDSGTRISSSLDTVGGGGRSILIGGPLVTETKKHTVQVCGNVDAVIGR